MALYDEVNRLVDLVERTAISEITLEIDGRRITVRKSSAQRTSGSDHPIPAQNLPAVIGEPAAVSNAVAYPIATIMAPMVGVFHHAEPPVGPGMRVEAGQVVGIIESMKLMNDVRAEESGTVREVLAEAGLAVEYGQPLFELDADESVLGI